MECFNLQKNFYTIGCLLCDLPALLRSYRTRCGLSALLKTHDSMSCSIMLTVYMCIVQSIHSQGCFPKLWKRQQGLNSASVKVLNDSSLNFHINKMEIKDYPPKDCRRGLIQIKVWRTGKCQLLPQNNFLTELSLFPLYVFPHEKFSVQCLCEIISMLKNSFCSVEFSH